MGCFSSTTTTESQTTIPKPTQQELDMMQLTIDALLPAYLDAQGWDLQEVGAGGGGSSSSMSGTSVASDASSGFGGKTTTKGKGGFVGKEQSDKRGELEGGNVVNGGGGSGNGGEGGGSLGMSVVGKGGKKYKITKKNPPDVQYALDKFGKDSKEYKDAYDSWKKSEVEKYKGQQNIEQLILDNTAKYMSGDFSLNDGQKQFLEDAFGPIKDASLKAIQYIKDEADNLEGNLGKSIQNFKGEVAKTGMNMGDAITILENRIKQTGVNMKSALNEEVGFPRKLNEMGLKDFSTDQRIKLQNQAVSLGRASTDPDFQLAMQENVNKEIERSNLELGQYSANKRLGIEERTGAGLEDAAKMRMGVAERTGQGMEEGAKMGLDVASQASGMRMQAAQMMGQSEIGLAENKANVWRDMVMGLPSTQIGTGLNVGQYQNALMQQKIQNAGAAMQAPLNIYNTLAANRYAQPSTKGTQTSSPSMASLISGLIGTGISGAASMYGAGMFGGGGSSG